MKDQWIFPSLRISSQTIMYIAFGGQGSGFLVVPLILIPVLVPEILFLISWLRTGRVSDPQIALLHSSFE